jgi:hypothetical protein
MAENELGRRVGGYEYYALDERVLEDGTPGKWVGVEIMASKYYSKQDPKIMVRKLGGPGSATDGPYYHCAEFVWNSVFLAGWHVPLNRRGRFSGYYISPNQLYSICTSLSELSSPAPQSSFQQGTRFKDSGGCKVYGLSGPQVGDVLVARHRQADEGRSGHYALLFSKDPLEFIEAGASVEITNEYELSVNTIGGHLSRIVRPILPDWDRINRWLRDREGREFHEYYKKDKKTYTQLMFEAVQKANEVGTEKAGEKQGLQQIEQILQLMLVPKWIKSMMEFWKSD